jgi:inosine-uridine nucleoside N-ribohydrolase
VRIIRHVAAIALIGGLVMGCGDDDGAMPVVVDGDGAFDDIKAILYLLERPDVEVVALTVSGTGIARCPIAAENLSALLERVGAPEIPVACGRTTPLEGNNAAPAAWRDAADTLGDVELPEPRPLSELDAPALLVDAVDNAGGDITLVALGPLTNVAEAIEMDPSFVDGISMMYFMGGAVDDGGNMWTEGNDVAEFNVWADPTAAARVFDTPVPITLVPLDATNDVPVTPYMYETINAHRDASPTAAFLADYLDVTPLLGGMYQWDELAAVIATDEAVATIEERNLAIQTDGPGEGATVERADGRMTRVATATETGAFEDNFYAAVIGTADTGTPEWQPEAILTWDGSVCSYEGPDPLPESFHIRIDNEGEGLIGFIIGRYDEGTTQADFEAAMSASQPGVPSWWQSSAEVVAPAGAHDVWPVSGAPDLTGLCYMDPSNVWEVAGPRLPA